jgi:Zn ribbon nucleic-acid-binding protein
MAIPTFDQLALLAILNNDTAEMRRLNTRARVAVGALCPDCNTGDSIEDNGRGDYRCTACGHSWDKEDNS